MNDWETTQGGHQIPGFRSAYSKHWCQRVGVLGLGSRLNTNWLIKWRWSQHISADQTPFPCDLTWIKAKREVVKSNRFSALKPDKLGSSCKANKRTNAGTGDLGVLTTRSAWMPPHVQVSKSEHRHHAPLPIHFEDTEWFYLSKVASSRSPVECCALFGVKVGGSRCQGSGFNPKYEKRKIGIIMVGKDVHSLRETHPWIS